MLPVRKHDQSANARQTGFAQVLLNGSIHGQMERCEAIRQVEDLRQPICRVRLLVDALKLRRGRQPLCVALPDQLHIVFKGDGRVISFARLLLPSSVPRLPPLVSLALCETAMAKQP